MATELQLDDMLKDLASTGEDYSKLKINRKNRIRLMQYAIAVYGVEGRSIDCNVMLRILYSI
jgi:hypothetical protein